MATITADISSHKKFVTSHHGQSLYAYETEIENEEIEDVGLSDDSDFPSSLSNELLEVGVEKLRDAIESGKEF